MVAYLMEHRQVSISRACRVVKLPKSMYYYKNIRDDSATIDKLLELSERHPTEGQDLYYSRIRQQGLVWNYKRVRRVYLLLGMNRRRKVRRRVPARVKVPLVVPERARETWSMDFMSDVLTSKRKFRTLNIIDDYNREAITVEAAHTMPATRVTQILERTIHEQGKPNCIRVDNGPEFNSKEFKDWCALKGITVQFTQPGKPMQNGYIERFNRTFRENILDAYLFEDINQVQVLADEWMEDYNYNRPHEALGGITPDLYKRLNCGDVGNSIEFSISPQLQQQ
jgi:putative transposase